LPIALAVGAGGELRQPLGVAVVGGLVWLTHLYLVGRYYQTTDDAYISSDLVQITSQVPGTVISVNVDDTQSVERGQVLAVLDPADAQVAIASAEAQLARAVRLLSPPHLVVVAGVQSDEVAQLARREARGWQDPWIALAAAEQQARAAAQRALLRRLGAPVVAASAERLEQSVFAQYEALRRARRV